MVTIQCTAQNNSHDQCQVWVDEIQRSVRWGKARHRDCEGKIVSVDPWLKGRVSVEHMTTKEIIHFENPAAEEQPAQDDNDSESGDENDEEAKEGEQKGKKSVEEVIERAWREAGYKEGEQGFKAKGPPLARPSGMRDLIDLPMPGSGAIRSLAFNVGHKLAIARSDGNTYDRRIGTAR